jgi:integrase
LADIQKYAEHIHSKGYAPATLSHYLNRVAKVFNYNCDKFEDNDRIIKIAKWCESMERLEIIIGEPEIIELDVFKKLYDNTHILLRDGNRNSPNIDLAMKAILMMGLNTASTLIDLSRLTKDEIDLNVRTLSTRRKKTGQVKKVAYLWEQTTKDLKAYFDSRKDKSNFVFLSRTGTAYTDSGLRKLFKGYRRELKLPDTVEFCLLRKTFSTVAKDLDIDPFKINCVMGHSNEGMVDTYSKRQISNNLKEACLAVEKEFFKEEKAV